MKNWDKAIWQARNFIRKNGVTIGLKRPDLPENCVLYRIGDEEIYCTAIEQYRQGRISKLKADKLIVAEEK